MTDFKRVFLYFSLAFILFLLWTQWQESYGALSQEQPVASSQQRQGEQPVSSSAIPAVPSGFSEQSKLTDVTSVTEPVSLSKNLITVRTDVVNVVIDTLGGNVVGVDLLDYKDSLDEKAAPYELLFEDNSRKYIAQSGVIGIDTPEELAQFEASQKKYLLTETSNELIVELFRNEQGINVTKQFRFKRGSYNINVDYLIKNNSSEEWSGNFFARLVQRWQERSRSFFMMYNYEGGAYSTEEKPFTKIPFADMGKSKLAQQVTGGWIAMMEHYFVSAWVPPAEQVSHFFSDQTSANTYTLGFIGPKVSLQPGEQTTLSASLYAGPEIAEQLKEVAPNLDLTVDYGFLWPISVALFWLMSLIYSYIGNWGWAIVLVTVVIKLVFYQLSAKSYRSMAGLRQLQPKILSLRERYADDKQKLSQAMIDLYRKEKINPLGGCLPILVQIPVFIALYWVLLESVELRHTPFILWIKDLSSPDPYFVLPLLMGLTMFIQQKLSPPPPDPIQAKVMMFLPIIFTVFFMLFPAGLVLYWVVNNALSILQQWYITKNYDKSKKIAAAKKT